MRMSQQSWNVTVMSAIHGNQSGTIPTLVLGVTMAALGNTMTKMTTKGQVPQANPARAQRVNQIIRHPCISCAEILLRRRDN
jgi:hypothetical protein